MLRAALCIPLLAASLLAQTVPAERTLAAVQRAFHAQRSALYAGDAAPTREQELALVGRQAAELESFLQHEAAGDDRWNGRLLLASLRLELRQNEPAMAALRGIDGKTAPGPTQLHAAELAMRLGDKALRDAFVQQATQRTDSLDERLQVARILMTTLREVEKGESIFAAALAAAADDEQRALVRWRQCDAIREREDLAENSYFDALDKLAKDLPDTYYGSVARDRAAASLFAVGKPANAFAVTTIDGTKVTLAELRGKAVLLAFWSPADPQSGELMNQLQALRRQHGENLFVLGIAVDGDAESVRRDCAGMKVEFPQVCDGRGPETELALRYGVEAAPTLIAIDRQGAIAGLNLHADTRDARDDLAAALQRALAGG